MTRLKKASHCVADFATQAWSAPRSHDEILSNFWLGLEQVSAAKPPCHNCGVSQHSNLLLLVGTRCS